LTKAQNILVVAKVLPEKNAKNNISDELYTTRIIGHCNMKIVLRDKITGYLNLRLLPE